MPDSIQQILEPKTRDLGEFQVRRTLPARGRQRVGPFIFFDHFGPVRFAPGHGVAVRPHPHIGLATVTFLFEGVIVHRDSLGYVQPIRPGAVNWMTAGRGIVHSERSAPDDVAAGAPIHGLQTWLALPVEQEEIDPRFEHYPAEVVPTLTLGDARISVIAGSAWDLESPVRTESRTVYASIELPAGAGVDVPRDDGELAVYAVAGDVRVDDMPLQPATMAVLAAGATPRISAETPSIAVLLGGEPLAGDRYLWWNFVSSSRERLERAKSDWREGRFDPVPGDPEFIPLPEGA